MPVELPRRFEQEWADVQSMSAEEKENARKKAAELWVLLRWFTQVCWKLPPCEQVRFVSAACQALESLGYKVDLDPGVMPS